MLDRESIDNVRSYRDLDSLNSIHDQQTQVPIENVTSPHRIKGSAGEQAAILVIWNPEGVPVCAEPVVVDRSEACDELITIGFKATTEE